MTRSKILLYSAIAFIFTLMPSVAVATGIIQEPTDPSILDSLAPLLNPIAVFLAIQAVKLVRAIAPSWTLAFVVPVFSAIGAWVLAQISPDGSALLNFFLGFGSVFIHKILEQFGAPVETKKSLRAKELRS